MALWVAIAVEEKQVTRCGSLPSFQNVYEPVVQVRNLALLKIFYVEPISTAARATAMWLGSNADRTRSDLYVVSSHMCRLLLPDACCQKKLNQDRAKRREQELVFDMRRNLAHPLRCIALRHAAGNAPLDSLPAIMREVFLFLLLPGAVPP